MLFLGPGQVPAARAQGAPKSVGASQPSGGEPTEIVLLGVGHFAGSVSDEYSSSVRSILSARRQRELDIIADSIARFAPDQFLVERRPPYQETLDSLYRAYRAGRYNPTAQGDRGEIRQLGFRAAKEAGLSTLRGIDAAGLWLADEAYRVAETHNPELLKAYRSYGGRVSAFDRTFLPDHTLGAWLRALNTDSMLYKNHKAYIYYYARMGSFDGTGIQTHWKGDLDGRTFTFVGSFQSGSIDYAKRILRRLGARVTDSMEAGADYVVLGDGATSKQEPTAQTLRPQELYALIMRAADVYVGFPDHHIGADLVGEWYKRNLRIYANIWRAVKPSSDRVIVMIGQGHIWTLRQFFRTNPDFKVVPVAAVL